MAASVSVVIPTHNRPRWLREAIESANGQSHSPVEVVVVDDGSVTDDARTIAVSYPGVHYVRQVNQGLGPARNTGIRESSGEFILFLDDDDWLTPDSVALHLKGLEGLPEAGLAYSDLYLASASGTVFGRYYASRQRPMPEGDIYEALLRRNFIPVHAVLWRRAALEAAGGFPTGGLAVEDWYLLLRAAETTAARFVDQPLGYYRLHDHNMSLNYSSQTRGAALVQRYVASSRRFSQVPAAFRARILASYAAEQWLDGDAELGQALLLKAQTLDHRSPYALR